MPRSAIRSRAPAVGTRMWFTQAWLHWSLRLGQEPTPRIEERVERSIALDYEGLIGRLAKFELKRRVALGEEV